MKSKREYKKATKIILIGDSNQKKCFLNEISPQTVPLIIDMNIDDMDIDFTINVNAKVNDYQIWFIPYQESLFAPTSVNDTQVVIYFSPDEKLKNRYERKRDPKKCIAIDFNKVDLKPKELIEYMDIFITKHPKEYENESNKESRTTFFFFAQQSMQPQLPRELTNSIGNLMMDSSLDLTNPLKPIYIAKPHQSLEIESTAPVM